MKNKRYLLLIFSILLVIINGFGNVCLSDPQFENMNCEKNNNDDSSLLLVIDKLIEKNKGYINETSEYKKREDVNKRPLYLNIREGDSYNGASYFSVTFSDACLYSNYLPTEMFEYQGIHVLLFRKNKKPLLLKDIPDVFFIQSEDYIINEESWIVLICKESMKILIVESTFLSSTEIKQVVDFSCNNRDSIDTQIKIEDPIIIQK